MSGTGQGLGDYRHLTRTGQRLRRCHYGFEPRVSEDKYMLILKMTHQLALSEMEILLWPGSNPVPYIDNRMVANSGKSIYG
jgi:hypothetical protein